MKMHAVGYFTVFIGLGLVTELVTAGTVNNFCDLSLLTNSTSPLLLNGTSLLTTFDQLSAGFTCTCLVANVGITPVSVTTRLRTPGPETTVSTVTDPVLIEDPNNRVARSIQGSTCGKRIAMTPGAEQVAYPFGCSEVTHVTELEPYQEINYDLYVSLPTAIVSDGRQYELEITAGSKSALLSLHCFPAVPVGQGLSTSSTSSSSSSTSPSVSSTSSSSNTPSSSTESNTTGVPVPSNADEYSLRHVLVSAVAGAVGGAIAMTVIIVVIIILLRRRRRRRRSQNNPEDHTYDDQVEESKNRESHIYSTIDRLYDSIKSRYDVITNVVSTRRGRRFVPPKRNASTDAVESKPDIILDSEKQIETLHHNTDAVTGPKKYVKTPNFAPDMRNNSLSRTDSDQSYIHPVTRVRSEVNANNTDGYLSMSGTEEETRDDYMTMSNETDAQGRNSDYLEPIVTRSSQS